MRKFAILLSTITLFNIILLPVSNAQSAADKDFTKPAVKNACLLDSASEDCKKEKALLSDLAGKTLANEATGKLSCSYASGTSADAIFLSLRSGVERQSILGDAVPQMQNPNIAQATISAADSQSVGMIVASESLSAASLTGNEAEFLDIQTKLSKKCSLAPKDISDAYKGQVQLVSITCVVQEILTKVSSLFQDKDTLDQQIIEMEAAVNQALAEDMKRDASIAKEKKKMKEINTELKKALDDLKKTKALQVKATADVAKATADLTAAQAVPCKTTTDAEGNSTQDCSARDAAVAAAQKVLDAANVKLEKAVKALEKSVKAVKDILVNKMGAETSAVLALLSGTVAGDADGQNVHFEVNGNDFTLINLQPIMDNYTGATPLRDLNTDLGSKYSDTTDYFQSFINSYDNEGGSGKGATPADSANVLDVFSKVGDSGITNLYTIGEAILGYTQDASAAKVDSLQAMKTPNTRYIELTKQIDKRRDLQDTLNSMIDTLICYLDVNLKTFRETYKLTYTTASLVPTPFFIWLNDFTTADLVKKRKEGLDSKINVEQIRILFGCMFDGGAEASCKAQAAPAPAKTAVGSKPAGSTCSWNSTGPVFGPTTGPSSSCSAGNIGASITQDGSPWICKCI